MWITFLLTLPAYKRNQTVRMAEKYTATFPVRITNKMARDLRAAAMREYMTVSQLIRKLLREALEKK